MGATSQYGWADLSSLHWVDYYVNRVLSCNILDFHSVFISKFHLHCLSECEVLMLSSNRMLVAFFKVTCIHWIQLNEHADIIFIPSTWSDDWPALYLLYLSLSLLKTLCTNKFEQYMMRTLGELDFHYENGYRRTKMHLNPSQPRVPGNLAA